MVMDKAETNGTATVRIENNILRGPTIPLQLKWNSTGQAVFEALQRSPEFIGQIDAVTGEKDSFGQILDRSIKCALWLKKNGIKAGDVVAVATENHLDTCVPCLAILFIGAICNPWDYAMNKETALHYLSISEAKILFANESAARTVSEITSTGSPGLSLVVFGEHPAGIPFSETLKGHSKSEVDGFRCTELPDARQTALILFSSGTTGLPKGVQIPHYSLLCISESCKPLNFPGQTVLWFSSISWISGSMLIFQAMMKNATRIVASNFEEETVWKLVEKFKVMWLFLGTSMLNRVAKFGYPKDCDISCLKSLLTGGASLKAEAQREIRKMFPGITITQGYGMTELGGLSTCQTKESPDGSVGLPITNSDVKIIDPSTGKILGPNRQGELCARVPSMSTGYYKNPAATRETIDEEGWLHSGDLGYYDEKGEVFIVERLKELIKYRGYHVVPGLIETTLQTHPAILEAAVIGLPHPTDDEWPIAFVSLVSGEKVTEKELVDLVAEKLTDSHKLRGGVKFLDTLPHNASGKISRKGLKDMAKTIKV